jgi:hypothetical protein
VVLCSSKGVTSQRLHALQGLWSLLLSEAWLVQPPVQLSTEGDQFKQGVSPLITLSAINITMGQGSSPVLWCIQAAICTSSHPLGTCCCRIGSNTWHSSQVIGKTYIPSL